MGVPQFFRCISERYPSLSELIREFQIPDFDNLYLDMNSIIHGCSHPNEFDPNFSITEEKIFVNIFHYIEVLFNLIKPKKLFFLAVDGVAPRAKMNQQRARRFRSAKEAEIRHREALEKGFKPLPKERFDSNCITPGTVFMDRLHSELKYFITSKISTDPLWQVCTVILSGHQTPGEGEHKIMDYIRYLKTLPDYNENTRHCLYGLDADLIMLGLCSHEPHFCLLREKVRFTKSKQCKQITSPDEMEFYLLHLSLLRDYLDLEFKALRKSLTFEYNLENIVDDWVLLSFLIGNDFIPNLPNLHINAGALAVLYKAYKDVLPSLDGYLNENGCLNLSRFQRYLEKLAKYDVEKFEDTYANLAFLEEKTGESVLQGKNGKPSRKSELEELIKATDDLMVVSQEEFAEEDIDENCGNDLFMMEFSQHKKNYYTHKLQWEKVTREFLKSEAEEYIRALQWNLYYYFKGCQSWSWYYPHHYAPYISDIKNFKNLKLDFEMGKPFLPFEQLLAVLPAASKDLIPEAYRHLITSKNSPVKDFYPENFEIDLNGKRNDWEAVVLIPFIDEEILLQAMKECESKLTPEERRRNCHGPMHVFTYTEKDLGAYKATEYFPSIPVNHALMKDVCREEIAVKESDLRYRLRSGASLGVQFPGFSTLRHIPHTATCKTAKIKVFDYFAKGESLILTLKKREYSALEVIATNFLGKIIYVNWPHLLESKVIAVSSNKLRYYLTEETRIECEVLDDQKQMQWIAESEVITNHYLRSFGIEIGPVEVIIYVLLLNGWKYLFGPKGRIVHTKIWSTNPSHYALQTVVEDLNVPDNVIRLYTDFMDAFPVDSIVFMLGQPHFGSKGRILDSTECCNSGRLKVELEIEIDPVVNESLLNSEPKTLYFSCRTAASKVGISCRLLSRITGTLLVSMTKDERMDNLGSKINIGLKLKFFTKNEEIPGYTKRQNDNWFYSMKAVNLVTAYVKKFARVVEYLSNHMDEKIYFVQEIFPGPEGATEMKEITAWINAQEYTKVERSKCGTNILDPFIVSSIEEIIDKSPKNCFTKRIQVKPHLLYKSDLVFGNVPPVKFSKNKLLDRVVSIRSSYTVPLGLRGFIIGIHPAVLETDYMYDILFDTPFIGGLKLNSSSERVFKMSINSFINITDGHRISQGAARNLFVPAFASSIDLNLRPEPTISAFAEWNQQPAQPVNQDIDDEFKKMWFNLQAAKPQENTLKKILKVKENKKANSETTEIEGSVKKFFEKVTKASSFNGTSAPFINSDQPKNNFYLKLFSYCEKQGLGQPSFKYLNAGGKMVAQVLFNNGELHSGLPCDDKESACESASLQALGALKNLHVSSKAFLVKEEEEVEVEKLKGFMECKMNLTSEPTKSKTKNLKKPGYDPSNKMPPLLPDPPSQWVGLNKNPQGLLFSPQRRNFHNKPKKEFPQKSHNSTNSKHIKMNASALEFVPLQAITGKRNVTKIATVKNPKPVVETKKKSEVVSPFIQNPGASSLATKRKRKPKIAANLNLDPNLC